MNYNLTSEQYTKYSQIKGWLLVFTIQMIVWLANGYFTISKIYGGTSGLELFFIIDILPSAVLLISMIFMFARDKNFVIIYYVFSIVSLIISLMIAAMFGDYSGIFNMLYCSAWCLYLYKSIRVKVYTRQVLAPSSYQISKPIIQHLDEPTDIKPN